jgi:hypothetical protein
MFSALTQVPASRLRCRLTNRECLFTVQYIGLTGEEDDGIDWGGLYRCVVPHEPAWLSHVPTPFYLSRTQVVHYLSRHCDDAVTLLLQGCHPAGRRRSLRAATRHLAVL